MLLQPNPNSASGRIPFAKSNLDEYNPPEFVAFDVLKPRGPPDEGKV